MRPSEFELQVFSRYDDATFAASGLTVTMATSHFLRIVDSSDGVTMIPARIDREWFQKLETLVFRTDDNQKGAVLLYATVVRVHMWQPQLLNAVCIPMKSEPPRTLPTPTTYSAMNAETDFYGAARPNAAVSQIPRIGQPYRREGPGVPLPRNAGAEEPYDDVGTSRNDSNI